MVNFSPLADEIGLPVWAPQQVSTGFACWLRCCSDVVHRRPTKLCGMFGRLLGWYTLYIFSGAFAPTDVILQGANLTLRPFLAFSCIGSITAWNSTSGRQPNFVAWYKEFRRRRHHLYSAGRRSRWASAHILVLFSSHNLSRRSFLMIVWIVARRASGDVVIVRRQFITAASLNASILPSCSLQLHTEASVCRSFHSVTRYVPPHSLFLSLTNSTSIPISLSLSLSLSVSFVCVLLNVTMTEQTRCPTETSSVDCSAALSKTYPLIKLNNQHHKAQNKHRQRN